MDPELEAYLDELMVDKDQTRMPQGWNGGFMQRAIRDFRPSENVEVRRSSKGGIPPLYRTVPEDAPLSPMFDQAPGFDQIITQVLQQMQQERANTSQVLSPTPVEEWR